MSSYGTVVDGCGGALCIHSAWGARARAGVYKNDKPCMRWRLRRRTPVSLGHRGTAIHPHRRTVTHQKNPLASVTRLQGEGHDQTP